MNTEIIKMIGGWIIYPLVIAYISIKIAKFHFEKGIKREYLLAKDRVANEILNSLCQMLLNMWELGNINSWISSGTLQRDAPDTQRRRQVALQNFHNAIQQSYLQLGKMGLYYGTEVVDQIAQLQSEWNDMVNNNNFEIFETWDQYRRERVLPILERVHNELRETVFEKTKSFRLVS